MKIIHISIVLLISAIFSLPMLSYGKTHRSHGGSMPGYISPQGEKVIIIDPRIHAFGAYTASGELVRTGMVTAGNYYCRDIRRGCKTKAGTFRIYSLGGPGCRSSKYPLPRGGAPMPYCMFFNGAQGLHGSYEVVYGNVSHGCVRMHVPDARWLRYNFVNHGTKVIVRPY
jgi:L,D-transpeptidase catalytic domain